MRYAVLAIIAMIAPSFSGCLSQEPPSPGSSSDPAERLSIWRRCLETSYAEARKKTADANAGADFAFQNCQSQEWQVEISALRAGVTPEAFARRKTDWKRALVQTGLI
jgi:hypothetical protein